MSVSRHDRGSASLELALLTPVFLALLLLIVFVGRRADVAGDVGHAAKVAAREATLHSTIEVGRAAAIRAATSTLSERSVTCPSPVIDVRSVEPHSVEAVVRCIVPMGDLTLLPVGGAQRIEASAVEPVDPYRGG